MRDLGYNSVRLILEYVVWEKEHHIFLKNFERYILNRRDNEVDKNKTIKNISIISKNNGYALLIYGIS